MTGKVFLNNDDLSAFPGEKEYLIGGSTWKVTKIEEASKMKATLVKAERNLRTFLTHRVLYMKQMQVYGRIFQ